MTERDRSLLRRTLVAFLFVAACGDSDLYATGQRQLGGASVASNRFTEHVPLHAAVATRQLGEDCTTYGRSACLTNVCLHYSGPPGEEYACSKTCRSQVDCPRRWRCISIFPAPGNEVCVPPADWHPAVAVVDIPRGRRER